MNRYAHAPKQRTRLDREVEFVQWVYGARLHKITERSADDLARDYRISLDFVKMHLARRMAAG
jgi:hypothetical protein